MEASTLSAQKLACNGILKSTYIIPIFVALKDVRQQRIAELYIITFCELDLAVNCNTFLCLFTI